MGKGDVAKQAGKADGLAYDPADADSVASYARRLVGHTLREMTDAERIDDPRKRRGVFGSMLEERYFHLAPNSRAEADFFEAGLELKSTPVRHGPGGLVAKERLVITMINYMTVVRETFETSHLMDKARRMLIVAYLYDKERNPLDYEVLLAGRWSIPSEDVPQIKHDWETVVAKVRAGRAEDISGSDTLYLEACTKAANASVRTRQPFSDVLAKPRAWALKASYMTAVENALMEKRQRIERGEGECDLDLLSLVRARFRSYFGRTEDELAAEFGVSRSKDRCARITRHILGVSDDAKIDEFEKAGVKPKTVRLQRSGMPAEDVSFPVFDYFALEQTSFEESNFLIYLEQAYLFVLYRVDADGAYRLSDVCFWQMPESDLPEAKRCYDQMRENVRRGRADLSVKATENRCCHVRPHGHKAADVRPQPHGAPVTKKCFWLNKRYLKGEIAKALGSGA